MKRLFALFFLIASGLSAFAQLGADGFYRIRNYGTGNYIWVCDNTGSINYAATTADMGAMQLWSGLDKAISEPASVIYLSEHDGRWDAEAQGTGVYEMIQHYVQVQYLGLVDGMSLYQIFATESGLTLYLSDDGRWSMKYEFSLLGTKEKGAARRWVPELIDASTDSYFGVKPSVTVGDKHYAPFYAAFAFSFASQGMKAYYITKVDGNIAVIKQIEQEVIPASTPVLIECSSTNPSDNRLNLLAGNFPALDKNLLKGVFFCNEFRSASKDAITAFDANTMRVWSANADGKLVLSTSTDGLHINVRNDDGLRYLNANQSFLPVSEGTPEELQLMTESEYESYVIANTEYQLTYNVDGVEYMKDSLKAGETINLPTAPVKEGYTFSGWSEVPATMPAHDVTVTGTFSINSYKVTFMYGETIFRVISVNYGEEIPLPESLDSDRYILITWIGVPATMPAHDLVIKANFVDDINAVAGIKKARYYQLDGLITKGMYRGLNIIRFSDGTTKKVLVK